MESRMKWGGMRGFREEKQSQWNWSIPWGSCKSLRQSLAETNGGKGTVTPCSAPAESTDGIHGILSCVMDSDIRVNEQALWPFTWRKDSCTNIIFCSAKNKCTYYSLEQLQEGILKGIQWLLYRMSVQNGGGFDWRMIDCILCKVISFLEFVILHM